MVKELWQWFLEKLAGFGRKIWSGLRYVFGRLGIFAGDISASTWKRVAVALPAVFFLYIIIGMAFVNRIDDDSNFAAAPPEGASHSVELMIRLIERETLHHNWTPNDPFFMPGWWLDNTPSYQRGMLVAVSRFSFELRDQIGRARGSSAADPNLEKAAGNLSKEPDRWTFDFDTSLLPTTKSDTFYLEGVDQLRIYNQRLAAGEAVFERRSDNLLATLDRIALDLGASSAALDQYMRDNAGGFLPDAGADNEFYQVKGQVYAYNLILKALRKDFGSVVENRDLGRLYDELLISLETAGNLDPLVVANGAMDGVLANHLALQGFYLLRARTQLRELTNILLK